MRSLSISSDRHAEYATGVRDQLMSAGIRADADLANEKIGYKIRQATVRKVPYLVIIGDNEIEAHKITVRKRDGENMGPFPIEEFIDILKDEISCRR